MELAQSSMNYENTKIISKIVYLFSTSKERIKVKRVFVQVKATKKHRFVDTQISSDLLRELL